MATDNLRFDFRVGQENYAALSPDTPVEITLDALSERSISGRVYRIVPVKNPSARTFLVRVLADADNAGNPLPITPGMSARGKLKINTGRSGVTVSRDAILRFSGQSRDGLGGRTRSRASCRARAGRHHRL